MYTCVQRICHMVRIPHHVATRKHTCHVIPHVSWRDETARSSISHGIASKIIPNLPIWGIKRELRGIMVIRVESTGNLGIFEISFGIWSNWTMNWDEKLGKMVFLERRLKDLSVESKITRFGLVITEKSKMEVERNFGTREEHTLN